MPRAPAPPVAWHVGVARAVGIVAMAFYCTALAMISMVAFAARNWRGVMALAALMLAVSCAAGLTAP